MISRRVHYHTATTADDNYNSLLFYTYSHNSAQVNVDKFPEPFNVVGQNLLLTKARKVHDPGSNASNDTLCNASCHDLSALPSVLSHLDSSLPQKLRSGSHFFDHAGQLGGFKTAFLDKALVH